MPTVRVDDEVYAWLESQAVGFDNPNAVLRRIAGLDELAEPGGNQPPQQAEGKLRLLIDAGLLSVGNTLVWERPRKGEIHQATLTETGCLRISDGTIFTDPSPAATHLGKHQANGWTAWKHGSETLADLRDKLKPK